MLAIDFADYDGVGRAEAAFAATLEVVAATAWNRSSMLQDIENGRATEIGFINGYIVDAALGLGIPAPVNTTLRSLVEAKFAVAASAAHVRIICSGSTNEGYK